ncbi:DNA-binding response regulator [Paenibacillus sp. 598K]|uniref:response regulator transcription factor n=1 Tax=Paenibacillus sp. 598K TaxID=1117987 RepID=UPI000FFA5A7C|nr:response regulator [Paenibacillus sp. 598K]GBF72538.1 DNA-binding response regulator [Paenibacillus sp. 598K]
MVNVLIAEDEAIILAGTIEQIRWDELGLRLAATASDGVDALRKVQELPIDIVITDIRMPGLSGLALIRQLKEQKPDLACIIISGGGEFAFAHEALQLGVSDYLLKPLKEQELNEALRRKKRELEERSADREMVLSLRDQYRRHEEMKQELALSRFLMEGAGEASELPRALSTEEAREWAVLVFAVDRVTYPHQGFLAEEEPLLEFGIKNIIGDCLRLAGLKAVVYKHAYNKSEFIAFVALVPAQGERCASSAARQAVHHLQRVLRLSAAAAVGRGGVDPAGWRQSYAEAAAACRRRVLQGYGQVYDTARERGPRSHKLLMAAEEKLMVQWLESRQLGELGQWLRDKLGTVAADSAISYRDWEELCMQIHYLIRSFLIGKDADDSALLGDYPAFLQTVASCNQWEDMVHELARQASLAVGGPPQDGRRTGEEIVEAVRRKIERDYQQPISLQWISQHYYINGNYFCKLFKERTGLSLTDYVVKVRMAHARRLIVSTDLQIRSIAEMVGYEDPAYFGLVFRRMFGESPVRVRGGARK